MFLPAAAKILALPAWALAEWILKITDFFSAFSFAVLPRSAFLALVGSFLLGLFIFYLMSKFRAKQNIVNSYEVTVE